MEIVAIGKSEFLLGFQLAGLKAYDLSKMQESDIFGLLDNKEIGIIVLSQETFDSFSAELREAFAESIQPVAVIISEEAANEELRSKIVKAIGVDLWS